MPVTYSTATPVSLYLWGGGGGGRVERGAGGGGGTTEFPEFPGSHLPHALTPQNSISINLFLVKQLPGEGWKIPSRILCHQTAKDSK